MLVRVWSLVTVLEKDEACLLSDNLCNCKLCIIDWPNNNSKFCFSLQFYKSLKHMHFMRLHDWGFPSQTFFTQV
jgi:hypothetical protein